MTKYIMPVYADEIKSGLAATIQNKNSIAYVSSILHIPQELSNQLVTAKFIADTQQALGNDITFDLYPVYTILVSTGWNRNDDIFDRAETWTARSTPEDKPFNLGHQPRNIIGHITANTIVDENLSIVDDSLAFEDVPEKFHILTSAVIYRHISSRDKTLEAEAAELIQGIENGEWFVSMECLFNNFDYGISYSDGNQQVIARNESTAFLTKHLRIYKGCGEYNGGKLGRVLRNITFSGKGLVENPANPDSIIINDTKKFVGVVADNWAEHKLITESHEMGEVDMADEKYVSQLEEQTKALQAQLTEANQRIAELGDVKVKSALAEKDTQIAKLSDELKDTQDKIAALEAAKQDLEQARDAVQAERTEFETKLTEANEKLAEIAKKSRSVARVSILVDKNVDKTEAEQIVAEFDELNDEKFARLVDIHTQAKKMTKEEEETEEEKAKKAKAKEEANANNADLDNAKADSDSNLSSSDTDETDDLMKSLASFLDTTMHGE
jgi:hypothetical protein